MPLGESTGDSPRPRCFLVAWSRGSRSNLLSDRERTMLNHLLMSHEGQNRNRPSRWHNGMGDCCYSFAMVPRLLRRAKSSVMRLW